MTFGIAFYQSNLSIIWNMWLLIVFYIYFYALNLHTRLNLAPTLLSIKGKLHQPHPVPQTKHSGWSKIILTFAMDICCFFRHFRHWNFRQFLSFPITFFAVYLGQYPSTLWNWNSCGCWGALWARYAPWLNRQIILKGNVNYTKKLMSYFSFMPDSISHKCFSYVKKLILSRIRT